jgi:hypothetical protein
LTTVKTTMRAIAVSSLLLVAACVQSSAVVCGDGRVCPVGTTCIDALAICATPDERDACQLANANAGEDCTAAGTAGVCIGAFVGATVAQLTKQRDLEHSTRVGFGAAKGTLVGILLKLCIGTVILIFTAIKALPIGGATLPQPSSAQPTPTVTPTTVPAAVTAPSTLPAVEAQ